MRLLLLGATGPTGLHVLGRTLDEGHTVTALVRSPQKLPRPDEGSRDRLTVLVADVADRRDVARAAAGQDAVLCTIGAGRNLTSDIIGRTAAALIPAMREAEVGRLVFLSSYGVVVGDTADGASLSQRFFYRTLLRKIYADKARADRELLASGLDVTVVHPVRLTNGPFTGDYRAVEHARFTGMPGMSRADVAHFMVSQLQDPTWSRRVAVLAPPSK
ncbi:NAD(P)-binding oxidoreductase [Streptomyces sp. G-G2]|uniref:NAD(P)-dependent oxidoreductase n=1 Tax=Streptomyces sp. G-G2 TaxID=3046201 RepID=UPI0024BAA79A|nr:NAD(P)-binding oxidoreductase [Streptomyces sp. G-G2]MDJ0384231.1 SDR family oxidoreductase [Streptomyces sp. G-G2]